MMKAIMALAAVFAVGTAASAAEPARREPTAKQTHGVKLTKEQLAKITAGKIEAVKVNGGGQTPNGQSNGVPSENQNPSGKAPPGQN